MKIWLNIISCQLIFNIFLIIIIIFINIIKVENSKILKYI